MTTYQRNRSYASAPEPEYGDLEIRCTWSGEYDEFVNVKISLEVKCVPNTQLQLLNVRGPGIFLDEKFLERISETEYHPDNEEFGAPRSPLFGFSPLAHNRSRDARSNPCDENMLDETRMPDTRLTSQENEEAPAASQSTHCTLKTHNTEPALASPVSSVSSMRPPRSPKSENERLIRSRKRSATDADFPDSGSDGDCERGGSLTDGTNRKARQLNPVAPTGTGDQNTEKPNSDSINRREIACPRSPRKLRPTKLPSPSLIAPNENVNPRSPPRSPGKGASATQSVGVFGQSAFKAKQIQMPSVISRPSSAGYSDNSASTSPADTAVESRFIKENVSESSATAASTAQIKPIKEARVRFRLPSDGTTETDSLDGRPLSSVTSRDLGTEPEERNIESSGMDDEAMSYYLPGNLREANCHGERTGPSDQPEVEETDGLVFLKNSERVCPATFKVSITIAIYVTLQSIKGWNDFEIPGIPKTGPGRIGVLLFLMPDNQGLEIRTTNVNRATFVENCLVAEFTNSGSLVLPLRRCDREYCGNIADFTVDQEIVSHSIVKTSNTSDGSDKSAIQMRFHAMCSIALYNRCFWSNRCTIFLYVDGGPDGCFKCDVTSQKHATKKILIEANDNTPMGVSRIQVTCSPTSMNTFYVKWEMEFPGQRAAYWVPRIYPASYKSYERRQESLRYSLLEVLTDPSYLFSGAETTEVDFDSSSEFTQSYKQIEIMHKRANDEPKETPFQQNAGQSFLSHIERVVQSRLARYYQNPISLLNQALVGVLCLAFLRIAFTPVQTPGQRSQVVWSPSEKLCEKGQENVNDQVSSNTGMGILGVLNGYTIVSLDVEEKESVGNEEQPQEDVGMEPGTDGREHEESPVSFRDRIDYWLGWSGPV
ncbi:hypothetical protein ASPVEDRAFT_463675 [Aspergillus versicolor CBS 583.65]|uniref:Uncharacterized protein n=1 Tax=Aspergillus versicolor CBS 583.65 TaxID=1036611 RepID=A0A1L9PAG2_ASPVE|nr:uncharacterized protein ASPVEDRAFT_463675 [Aspergillus versicolor CBS 583.65]OJI98486.1 hypothetical protein ASPVEDRAFT_463675 [Aspergillus versicolor CBS 583.65]